MPVLAEARIERKKKKKKKSKTGFFAFFLLRGGHRRNITEIFSPRFDLKKLLSRVFSGCLLSTPERGHERGLSDAAARQFAKGLAFLHP